MVRSGVKALAASAAAAALYQQCAFVPGPQAQSRVPAASLVSGVGAAAALGAAPAFADEIGNAAVKLSEKAYPFMKEVDWFSYLFLQAPGRFSPLDWLKAVDKAIVMGEYIDPQLLRDAATAHHKAIGTIDGTGAMSKASFTEINAAIGRMIASVPEEKVLDVYQAFKALVRNDVPKYLMSTVNEQDAKAAYKAFWEFKDVVKAHPTTAANPGVSTRFSAEKLDAVGAAAGKLSKLSYPFIKDVDWTSDIYLKPLPGQSPKDVLQAVDKMIVMGTFMDSKLLREAAEAHHKAIASVDSRGVTSLTDYTAVNAALGKLIASVPQSQVMEVYNSMAKLLADGNVANNMFQFSKKADAIAAYKALMDFKDVVKAAQV